MVRCIVAAVCEAEIGLDSPARRRPESGRIGRGAIGPHVERPGYSPRGLTVGRVGRHDSRLKRGGRIDAHGTITLASTTSFPMVRGRTVHAGEALSALTVFLPTVQVNFSPEEETLNPLRPGRNSLG